MHDIVISIFDLPFKRNLFVIFLNCSRSLKYKISLVGIYNILHKWKMTGGVKDLERSNLHQKLIYDLGLQAINKFLFWF